MSCSRRSKPLRCSYLAVSHTHRQQIEACSESQQSANYTAHPILNLAVTKQQLQEPDLTLTLPFTDNMVAPSICIHLADWMSTNAFEVVCFEPEATRELTYIRFGIVQFNVMQNHAVWECKQISKLLKGESSMLTVQPFHQAAALLVDFMNMHFR